MFSASELRNHVHRTWTIESVDGRDVFETVRPNLSDRISNAVTFKLEDTCCVASRHNIVNARIRKRNILRKNFLSAVFLNQLKRILNVRKSF